MDVELSFVEWQNEYSKKRRTTKWRILEPMKPTSKPHDFVAANWQPASKRPWKIKQFLWNSKQQKKKSLAQSCCGRVSDLQEDNGLKDDRMDPKGS
eukprot:scaffold499401_cov17-Prasinocladus_malaysianus.AAC.1